MNIQTFKFIPFLLLLSEIGYSQALACSISDFTCLDNKHVQACNVRENTIQSCLSWLSSVEDLIKENPPVAELNLVKGVTHFSLHEMFRNSDPELSVTHKNLAKSSYQLAYEMDENSIHAMRGLSSTSETSDELKSWNYRILEKDPSDTIASQRIASLLIQENGKQGYIDSANLLINNYQAMDPGSGKWSLAERIVEYLEISESKDELDNFLQKVSEDMSINEINEIASEEIIENPDIFIRLIGTSCYISTMRIFGENDCLTGVRAGLQTPLSDDLVWTNENLDEFLYSANTLIVQMLSENNDTLAIETELKQWLDALVDQGTETASMYQMYQYLLRDEPQRGLVAALRAAELEPDNANYQLMAGRWLLKTDRAEEGLEYFERAKQYLPPSRHQSVDMLIQSAQNQL